MFQKLTPVVKNLIIINVLFYVATMAFGPQGDQPKLLTVKLGVFYPGSPFFELWQVVTHMFMHSQENYLHIFFNMFALYMFGGTLEKVWGAKRFLQFYFVCGLGAFFIHELVIGFQVFSLSGSFFPAVQDITPSIARIYTIPTVGASGAIYGLLLAFGMLFPNTQLMLLFPPIPIKAKWLVMILGAFALFSGFNKLSGSEDNVAHFAHLGGMLFGFFMIRYWKKTTNTFY